MKKYIKHIISSVFLMGALVSCEDRELITTDLSEAPIVVDLSSDKIFLDKNFPNNNVLSISWKSAEYTVPVEKKYKIEASSDEGFTKPYMLGTVEKSERVLSLTTKQINDIAKEFKYTPNIEQKIFIRVTSFVGASQTQLAGVSNTTFFSVVPYKASPIYPYTDLYLIGDATAGAWVNEATNMNMYPLLKSTNASKYTFTGYFKDSEKGGFKIVKTKGSWDVQYGLGSSAGILSTEGGSGNIPVKEAGYYKVTVDISALTYTFEKVSNSTHTYSSISIIGSVNGNWNTDTQLVQSEFDPHVWVGSDLPLKGGEFKFRANNNWDTSWGAATEYFGTATLQGANIPVSADWNYNVYFNDLSGDYTIIPVN